jgi:dihydropyrimidinase
VLYTHGVKGGHFSLERLVELGAAAPARIFGLAKKGSVAVGMDADLVIFDPAPRRALSARTHHSRADRSIFEGQDVQGRIERTIVGGRVAFENGKLMAEKGSGRFIARKPTHFATHAELNA